ncbi:protein DMP3-like [Macadamia integrifolia]|uniref:protein DMP3-like n=1 Tax=Macadamia integrifolia TaxID=60698 RepID=UPI001C4F6862|nr:protein DMP3-like [Macadamia integrifolia]
METEKSLRSRTKKDTGGSDPTSSSDDEKEQLIPSASSPSSSSSQRAISATLASAANLANLLPTGTLMAFQLLIPIFTNNGTCDSVTRPLTMLLLILLSVSCFLVCFTDSIRSDGQVYHGIATPRGMWLFDYSPSTSSSLPDLSKYKLRPLDFVHGTLTVLVFISVALRDRNVTSCFYPQPKHETQEVLDIVPMGLGLMCSLLFMVFPTIRHGIGYPVTPGK